MKPHGGYKYAWPEDYGDMSRSGAKAAWRSSAVVDMTTALTHEELALIASGADPDACDAERWVE
jgi:hypothetical protein